MLANETVLCESANLNACRIDKVNGIIYDVKVLTESGNRSYPRATRSQAIALINGCKVNINHAHKLGFKEVALENRFGWLENARDTDAGTIADLHYDTTDSRAKKVEWAAEKRPDMVALSIHGKGRCVPDPVHSGREICEEIYSLQSVDLVADGGSTKSLFESADMEPVDQLDTLCGEITTLIKDATKAPSDKLAAIGVLLKVAPTILVESKSPELQVQIDALTLERDIRVLCESLDVKTDDVMLKALTRLDNADERRAFVTSVKRKMVSQAPRSGSTAVLSESKGQGAGPEDSKSRLDRLAALAKS